MSDVVITAGGFRFEARFETAAAPRTCEVFRTLLPFKEQCDSRALERRGDVGAARRRSISGLSPENATTYPRPGEIILYPGGVSETEVLIAYGYTNFASKAGQLAGNHFLTIVSGHEHLTELGKMTLWKGAQDVTIQLGAVNG